MTKKVLIKKLFTLGLILAALGGGLYAFSRVYVVTKNTPSTMVAGEMIRATREVAIPVLLYHGIVENEDGTNVTISNFREQMAALADKGYTTVDTHDLLEFYTAGTQLPEKPVVITFDDGRRDSYLNGSPILAEHGFKAVMFVVTEKQENQVPGFLSWDELCKMHQSGLWDIEAHGYQYHKYIDVDGRGTQGHFACNKKWLPQENRLETDQEYEQRLLADLQRVKSDLEFHIAGLEVVAFAFPYGDYGESSLNIDRELAISLINKTVNTVFPLSFELNSKCMDFCNYEDSGHDMLKRFAVKGDMTAQELVMALEKAQPRKLPYVVEGFDSEWKYYIYSNWGDVNVANGALKLKASEGGTGAMAVLSGGHYWKDYAAEAELLIEAGENGYLVGRFKDNNNYVFCEMDGNFVTLAEKVGGKNRILGKTQYVKPVPRYTIRLSFKGDTVSCSVDDTVTLGPLELNPSLEEGTAGFKAWDKQAGLVRVSVLKVNVTPVEEVLGLK